jgi:excisionase family DNA binding protein
MKRQRKRDDPERHAFSVAEVARKFGVSPKVIRRGIEQGRIPKLDLGGRVLRVPRNWVEQQLGNPLANQEQLQSDERLPSGGQMGTLPSE